MPTESGTLTLLPNGVHEDAGFLRVTIFVSPRLLTDDGTELDLTPANFPSFSDWPQTLSECVFNIDVEGIGTVDAVVDPDSLAPDSATWHALFDKTKVGDGTFKDQSDTQFPSFPVVDASKYILDLYTVVAESYPNAFPPITTGPLATLVNDIGNLSENGRQRYYPILDNELTRTVEGPNGRSWRYVERDSFPVTPQGDRDPLYVFTEAYRFHDRPGARELSALDPPLPPPDPPKVDFHGFVAFCGDYPKLMRRLGLAFDVLMEQPQGMQEDGRIRLEVRDTPADWMTAEAARPWTNYEIEDRRFLARPNDREGDLVDGMLRLEWLERFQVNQIDVDGSALKTVDFAGNLQRVNAHLKSQNGMSMTPDASSLPALRSSGFMISRDARNKKLIGHLGEAAGNEDTHAQDDAADLWAEDVNRGFRLDVEDQKFTGRWRSLHHRVGDYLLQQPDKSKIPLPAEVPPDEGYVKGASTSAVPGKEEEQYLHEAMFGWEGWSLAAKRPGQAITNTAVAPPAAADADENPYPMPLVTHFDATPGTLPRLRFGRTYRFRARAVDLAGNSVREDDIDPEHVTQLNTWWRWDPVPSPAVVPRRQFTEGESLMRMVIRSTLDVLPDAYVQLGRITTLEGHNTDPLRYLAVNDRHVAPPFGSQQLAEWHAKFDVAIGESSGATSLNAQFDIAARESGSFLQDGPGVFVVNPSDPANATVLTPQWTKEDRLASGEYVCHDVDQLDLPYLPDPLSVGASFTSLPGAPGTWLQQWEPAAGAAPWYDRRPLRVRIEDGSGAPVYDANRRLLTVLLPQAEMVTVNLSSYLTEGTQELFGPWMIQRGIFRSLPQRRAASQEGRAWMLTPWSQLTLVHAVEKPLAPPVVEVPAVGVPNTGVQRFVGETFAVLSGVVQNHAKSTGRLDVEATWSEPVDDVLQPAPDTLAGNAHVGDFQLLPSEDVCRIDRDDAPASGTQPPKHELRHEFKDTKHRNVSYQATATTRFREYFPPVITNDRTLITHAGPEALLNIPSSRRPDPPDLLYVVPTWTFDEQTVRGLAVPNRQQRLASTLLRTRSGGGLRVYMNRPWWSSGEGELLGVVLTHQPWLTWSIDAQNGLFASAVAQAVAEEFAQRAIDEGLVKPAGKITAAASERLLAGVMRTSGRVRARRGRAKQTLAAATALSHDVALSGLTTMGELAELESVIGAFLLQSGDPQKFVTHWGRDPIWGSDQTSAGPYIHQFPLRTAVGYSVSLLEAPGHDATVVGHTPEFDHERKLWYCDLQVDAGSSYFPFVKLALARYQPDSITGQHLSKVVFPDFAQLVAERTAALTKIGRSGVRVSLRGPAGYTYIADVLASDEDERMNLSRFVVAQMERLPANATTDLAWSAAGEEVRLDLAAQPSTTDVRFSGTLPLPTRGDGEQLRVALREYEIFESDATESDDVIVRPVPGDTSFITKPVKYRLVYAEYLEL